MRNNKKNPADFTTNRNKKTNFKSNENPFDHGVGSTDHSAAEEPIRNQKIYIDKYKGAKEE